jgi:hypothetical protein
MGHLLKMKCLDSRVNVHILDSTSVPFTLTTVQVHAKFSPNSLGADNSVVQRTRIYYTKKYMQLLVVHVLAIVVVQ